MSSLREARERHAGLRILDVRSASAFARGHLPGAGHCTPDAFVDRRMELPARDIPLLCVDDDPAQAEAAARQLLTHGMEQVTWLACPLADEPDGHADVSPAARLWSPSPFLERVLPSLPPGRALDLASGTGRAAVFLASLGHEVEAWDVDASALERAEAFAGRHGVHVRTRAIDLERTPPARPETGFDVIVVVRYLHRPLFPWLEAALAPGGSLLLETFLRGQEQHGHPKRDRFLLERGEASRAFPSLVVEHCDEDPLDARPVMARLHARRPR